MRRANAQKAFQDLARLLFSRFYAHFQLNRIKLGIIRILLLHAVVDELMQAKPKPLNYIEDNTFSMELSPEFSFFIYIFFIIYKTK